ncbi:NADP-dependent oxidoreductase [Nocardioides panacisoli]|uniref:NADP-dependent oxidoreductase n=1 Tax=Nocardioides panacisoli TaxID=627624 RepID=UPI001F34A0B7|nr:NADP-dependent oxidoreductase [Nocardioides panacisoli]
MTTTNTRVLLHSRPEGEPTPENFEIDEGAVPEPREGQVLLRTRYLSLDPYMRGRMSTAKSYADPVELGQVMVGGTVSEVVESRDPALAVGDVVVAHAGWQEYAVARPEHVRRLDPEAAPISTALGVLGMPGFTAYAGLTLIGRPQPGETVVVAAASGPVGATVGQIAKILGARAVGIAGGPEKVAHVEELGFDAAIDHRAPDFADQLAAATPDGIDVYFENVGGHVWDAVLRRLNTYARVPVCGLVAHYNQTELPPGPDRMSMLMQQVLIRSLTVRGFIQTEFVAEHEARFLEEASAWVRDGRLQYREDVVDGLANAPEAFIGMLRGQNFGKLVVRVS